MAVWSNGLLEEKMKSLKEGNCFEPSELILTLGFCIPNILYISSSSFLATIAKMTGFKITFC